MAHDRLDQSGDLGVEGARRCLSPLPMARTQPRGMSTSPTDRASASNERSPHSSISPAIDLSRQVRKMPNSAPPRRGLGLGAANGDHVSDGHLFEVAAEFLASGRVAELGHGFGLDLPDPLPGDPVDLADLVQGAGLAVGQPVAQPDHAGFPF